MAKFYSGITFLILFLPVFLVAQNVGVGTSNPQEKLDVNGAIRIGNTTDSLIGTIRYNDVTHIFEGRDTSGWVPFKGGGNDEDWIVDGDNMYAGVNGFVGIGIATPEIRLQVLEEDSAVAAAIMTTVPGGVGLIGYGLVPNSTGILGIADGKSPILSPLGSSGGVFYGSLGVYAVTDDTAGYGIMAHNISGKGNAGLFIGDTDFRGALRNTDSTLYGGSVAVNDGITVGLIAGSSCFPTSPVTSLSFADTLPGNLYFNGTSNTYDNIVTTDSGDCRSITSVYYECTFIEGEGWPIDVDIFLRGEYMGEVAISSGNVYYLVSGPPSHFVDQDTVFSDFYTTWRFVSTAWNGTDPDSTNWYTRVENFGTDSDYWHSYRATIFYKYGFASSAPLYADFGEIRASGTLYANSTSAYGDVAEFFRVEDKVRSPEPGDIVSIDVNNPETFNLTAKPYDPLMAGVISENPSVFLNDPNAGEPIALTGRVKVKVNTEGGAIKPGDPITSSSILGVGMKAEKNGLVLGQALEYFDGARAKEGMIWILLGKGHYENIKHVEAVEGTEIDLEGVTLTGAKKVKYNEKSVFVAWNENTPIEMPDDVEFEDLVIDLTPYGGSADLFVEAVTRQGFMINIDNASSQFKGFYYKVDLVSEKLHPAKMQLAQQNNISNKANSLTLLSKDEIKSANRKRFEIATQLEQLTGKSVRNFPQVSSLKEGMRYKDSVMKSWQNADPALYHELKELEKQLYATINADRTLIKEFRATTE